MDKKIKHRILGMLVIAGLVIISLPLFQTQNIQSTKSLLKAPPFPDPVVSHPIQQTTALPEPPVMTQQPDDTIKKIIRPPTIITGSSLEQPEKPANKKAITAIHKNALTPNLFVGPKWAVQLGSFKDKNNALRLVNHLRKNGYKAFIRQISNTFGDSTRVYVGPELKRPLARKLADQLEDDLHIKGIIVSYKPLEL